MRDKHEELVNSLHGFADWLEKSNHVHCDSLPRKAAYTIARLEEENYQMHLRLNKRYLSFRDRFDMVVGFIRLRYYLLKKKLNR